jgi:hypothetical protein
VLVELQLDVEAITGSPDGIKINKYGLRGYDNPQTDIGSTVWLRASYANYVEPVGWDNGAGVWGDWIDLGSTAAADLTWCRKQGYNTWAIGIDNDDSGTDNRWSFSPMRPYSNYPARLRMEFSSSSSSISSESSSSLSSSSMVNYDAFVQDLYLEVDSSSSSLSLGP